MNTTFIIKTLERPDELARLLGGLRTQHPDERVLVADDSRDHTPAWETCRLFDAELLELEHDVGLSAGRNALVEKVDTETFVLLDDDFLMERESHLERLVGLVEAGLFDIAGGALLHNGSPTHFQGMMRIEDRYMVLERRICKDGSPIDVDITWNFWAGRTAKVLEVLWDERLKVAEHHDFFLRCKANGCAIHTGRRTRADLHVGFFPGSVINHIPGTNPAYAPYRHTRSQQFWQLVLEKYQILGVKGALS